MNVIQDLKWRYATKQFDQSKEINPKNMDHLLEGLSLSASSYGLQPWKFLVIKNKELRKKLLPFSYNQTQIITCSHLIVFTKPTNFSVKYVDSFIELTAKSRGIPLNDLYDFKKVLYNFIKSKRPDELNTWISNQIYLSLGTLLTVAANLRIDACPMEGFSREDYDQVLNLDQHSLSSVVICPVGYRKQSDPYANLTKVRYSIKDTVIHLK